VAAESLPAQIAVGLVLRSLYAAVLGVSLLAPVALVVAGARGLLVAPLGRFPDSGRLVLSS